MVRTPFSAGSGGGGTGSTETDDEDTTSDAEDSSMDDQAGGDSSGDDSDVVDPDNIEESGEGLKGSPVPPGVAPGDGGNGGNGGGGRGGPEGGQGDGTPDPDPITIPDEISGGDSSGDDSDVVDPDNIEESGEDMKGSPVPSGVEPGGDGTGGRSERPSMGSNQGTPDQPSDGVDVAPSDFDQTNPEYEGEVYSQVEDDLIDEEGASNIYYAETDQGLVARYEADGQTQYASIPFEEDGREDLSETASELQQQENREQVAGAIEGLSLSDVRFVDGDFSRGTQEAIGQAALADQLGEETANELGLGTEFTYDEESGSVELTPFGEKELARDNVSSNLGGLEPGEDFEVVYESGGTDGESSVGVEYTSEEGRRAALREQYGEDAEIERIGEGAFEVTAPSEAADPSDPSTAPSATGAPDREGETVVVPFSEEGQQTVEDLQEAVSEQQAAVDQQEQAREDLAQGNLGDAQEILREDIAADAGEGVSPEDVTVERSGGDVTGAVTGSPREEVVAGLEEQTDIDLTTGDVDFEETVDEDGEEVISGELDSEAMRRYRQEQAPGQGTPLEGLFETGAGLQYDYEQATEPAVDTFNRYTPDVSGVEDTFNQYTPDLPSSNDILGVAAAGAPVAAAEPTPLGELAVGGIAVAGGLVLAGEELSQRTQASGSASATTTEVDVPEEQFADELSIDGAASQFPNELATPAGVTSQVNRGELSPSRLFVESELDATAETSVDEIQVGDDDGSTSDVVDQDETSYVPGEYPTTDTAESPASPGGDAPTGPGTPTGPPGPQGPTVPSRQPGEIGGGGAFGGIAGRDLPQQRGFQDAEQSFFGVDIVDAFDPIDPLTSADQASIGGSQADSITGVGAGLLSSTRPTDESIVDIDADAASEAPSNTTAEASSTATSTPQSTAATTANVDAFGVTTTPPRFMNRVASPNAFNEQFDYSGLGYGAGLESTSGRRPRRFPDLPDPEPSPNQDRDDMNQRFSEVFENPTIEASEAVDFDSVDDDLDDINSLF